jgi:hypothetical protein
LQSLLIEQLSASPAATGELLQLDIAAERTMTMPRTKMIPIAPRRPMKY